MVKVQINYVIWSNLSLPSLSPPLGTGARIFLDLFQQLTSIIFLVVGNMPMDSGCICGNFVNFRICQLSLPRQGCVLVFYRGAVCTMLRKKESRFIRSFTNCQYHKGLDNTPLKVQQKILITSKLKLLVQFTTTIMPISLIYFLIRSVCFSSTHKWSFKLKFLQDDSRQNKRFKKYIMNFHHYFDTLGHAVAN